MVIDVQGILLDECFDGGFVQSNVLLHEVLYFGFHLRCCSDDEDPAGL